MKPARPGWPRLVLGLIASVLVAITAKGAAAVPEDAHATLVAKVLPKYPAPFRKSGLQGRVKVVMLVGKDGRVTRAIVVKAFPCPDSTIRASFDSSAVTAARRWRFQPAVSNGQPVSVWESQDFVFLPYPKE